MRYLIDGVRDDQGLLQERLDEIAERRGRIISLTWQPARMIDVGTPYQKTAGYLIVSEYET